MLHAGVRERVAAGRELGALLLLLLAGSGGVAVGGARALRMTVQMVGYVMCTCVAVR